MSEAGSRSLGQPGNEKQVLAGGVGEAHPGQGFRKKERYPRNTRKYRSVTQLIYLASSL